jgi:hypothetical protein
MGKDTIKELMEKQLDNVPEDYKLSESDLKRILKYIVSSLFDKDKCCLWNGYITTNKGLYVNFYFKKKKMALHRLLYLNFIGEIYENNYLTYNCHNKGKCCNINHIERKKKYIKSYNNPNVKEKTTVYFD